MPPPFSIGLGLDLRLGGGGVTIPTHPTGMTPDELAAGWWGTTTLTNNPSVNSETDSGYFTSVRWDKARVVETSGSPSSYGDAMEPPYSDGPTEKYIGGFPSTDLGVVDGVLNYLACNSNSLTTLDVSTCTSLAILDCIFNSLTTLDVSTCTSLTELYCYFNALATLDVTGCASLAILDCNTNALTSLDVSTCASLQYLYCQSNSLATLDVTGCASLAILDCNTNALTSLDVSTCASLVAIYCNTNSLTTLDVSTCTSLTELYCYSNALTDTAADDIIIALDANGVINGQLYISNNNGRTSASDAAHASLLSKGWSIDIP